MSTTASTSPTQRVVLLGASNLALGLGHALERMRASDGSVEVLCAHGHGRSYVGASKFLWRERSGLLECGLWDALARAPSLPTRALVMDVGNDLAYGFEPALVADRVRECVARLAPHAANIAIAGLPWQSLASLGPVRFHAARLVFFKGRRLDRSRVVASARELDLRLADLARERDLSFVPYDPAWIGWDGFHHRRGARAEAFARLLAPLGFTGKRAGDSLRVSLY